MSPDPDTPLPTTLGKPALRARACAGISTLGEAAAYSDAELLALHGVGPKAQRQQRQP